MSLRLYNTLTRRVEPFVPLAAPRVTLYTCGPTVYNYAHIGNFRTFLFEDLLRRYLEAQRFEVLHIMNLTDVDDRTIKAATTAGVPLIQHTEPFVKAFFEDRDYLRIRPAHVYPRATQYIGPMVELVSRLLERGLAYRGEDGVYFAIGKFPTYGCLSQVDRRELKVGARVASDEYAKEDARDFALWKFADGTDERAGAAWDAPFGRGRPGWHLECSAMSLQEIGRLGVQTLDIHAGGVDLVFPHHENEIAQSEGVTGQPFARYWLHGEFLNLKGTKMSKRFGNILTARDLREEGVDPAAFRMLVFSSHYRQPLDYNDEALEAAAEGVRRLGQFRERLVERAGGGAGAGEAGGSPVPTSAAAAPASPPPPAVEELRRGFQQALDDDLNAPQALAAVFTFVRAVNRGLDGGTLSPAQVSTALGAFDGTLAILDVLPTARALDDGGGEWVELLKARTEARKRGDYAEADRIRAQLLSMGYDVVDTPSGPKVKKR